MTATPVDSAPWRLPRGEARGVPNHVRFPGGVLIGDVELAERTTMALAGAGQWGVAKVRRAFELGDDDVRYARLR